MKTIIKSRAPVLSLGNEAQEGAAQGSPQGDELVGDAPSQSKALTAQEREDFDRHCARLKQIENTWMEFGETLLDIRQRRLYRGKHRSFEAFCRHELAMGKSNADRIVQCAQVAKLLATIVAIPLRESHVRPLLALNDSIRVGAFQQAVDQAEKEEKPFTAVFVKRAVREVLDAEKPERVKRGSTKSDVITRTTRLIMDGLQRLSIQQLEAFEAACRDFKESWLEALPPSLHEAAERREAA